MADLNRPEVAIAILYQNQQFLMQLRDDIPGIPYPGHWGFFGGHLDPGETPAIAIHRELLEEIGYAPATLMPFRQYQDVTVIRHVFHAPLTVPLATLQLNEGWDMQLLTLEDVQRGNCYSPQADQVRPLGQPHQQILLDFYHRLT
jgi:8-oxo-dGTP pyrophosphatase MutT (NUDIX family)